MSETISITDQTLRSAMRDTRYWQPNNPERSGFSAWVTDGFRALNDPAAPAAGVVHVRAYTRNGRTVAAHDRSATSSGTQQAAVQSLPTRSVDALGPYAGVSSRLDCDLQARIDEACCRQIAPGRTQSRQACWESVNRRYAACIVGAPLPALRLP